MDFTFDTHRAVTICLIERLITVDEIWGKSLETCLLVENYFRGNPLNCMSTHRTYTKTKTKKSAGNGTRQSYRWIGMSFIVFDIVWSWIGFSYARRGFRSMEHIRRFYVSAPYKRKKSFRIKASIETRHQVNWWTIRRPDSIFTSTNAFLTKNTTGPQRNPLFLIHEKEI